MKQSLRAKRMEKHHRRLNQVPKLNLVSLMDIFTILVFFLLVNSGDVEVLQTDKSITLPASFSEEVPKENLVILVSATDLVVGGRSVGSVQSLAASAEPLFAPLQQELQQQAERAGPSADKNQTVGRAVTIMADHNISYELLKKIMATCAGSGYRDISLAVTKKERPASGDEG